MGKRKPGYTFEQHQELGKVLKEFDKSLVIAEQSLLVAYPKRTAEALPACRAENHLRDAGNVLQKAQYELSEIVWEENKVLDSRTLDGVYYYGKFCGIDLQSITRAQEERSRVGFSFKEHQELGRVLSEMDYQLCQSLTALQCAYPLASVAKAVRCLSKTRKALGAARCELDNIVYAENKELDHPTKANVYYGGRPVQE